MEWVEAAALIFGALFIMLALGVPVAFAFITVLLFGGLYFMGPASPAAITRGMLTTIASFTLVPIPLFVMLAGILFHSGLAVKVLDAADMWLGRLPARLSIVGNIGGMIFAAISGSAIAGTAMLGALLLPEMLRRGYGKRISLGALMATGGVEMIIPPSILGVVYATVARVSVADILIGGIIPGLMMVVGYTTVILGIAYFVPGEAPPAPNKTAGQFGETIDYSMKNRVYNLVTYILPLGFVIFLVNGLITLGIATPSESAALGVAGMIILAIAYRRFNFNVLMKSTTECVKVTAMTLLIVTASLGFSQLVGWTGITQGVISLVTESSLPDWGLILGLLSITLLMGTVLDSIAIIMLTAPFYGEVLKLVQADPVWFGMLMLVALKIGLTTPPFGILLFVMKGVAPPSVTMVDVWRAAIPFVLSDVLVLTLLWFFPALVTWLPSLVS